MNNEKEFDALDIPEEEHKKTVQALRVTELVRHKSSDLYAEKLLLRSQIKPHQDCEESQEQNGFMPPIKSADSFAKPPIMKSADSLGFGSATMSYESFGFDFFVKGNETHIDECMSDLLKEIKEYIIKNYDTKAVGLFEVGVHFHTKDSSIFYFPTTRFFLASDGTLIGYS